MVRSRAGSRVDIAPPRCHRATMPDSLILEVADLDVDVLTGIYSEETGRPQPLRISISAKMKVADHYAPDTSLSASKNYMDLKFAATQALTPGVHFKLIESVADHICETLLVQDARVLGVTVKIIKLAIAENGEQIGITLHRDRR
jgi:dihydroneopterin aldolase